MSCGLYYHRIVWTCQYHTLSRLKVMQCFLWNCRGVSGILHCIVSPLIYDSQQWLYSSLGTVVDCTAYWTKSISPVSHCLWSHTCLGILDKSVVPYSVVAFDSCFLVTIEDNRTCQGYDFSILSKFFFFWWSTLQNILNCVNPLWKICRGGDRRKKGMATFQFFFFTWPIMPLLD